MGVNVTHAQSFITMLVCPLRAHVEFKRTPNLEHLSLEAAISLKARATILVEDDFSLQWECRLLEDPPRYSVYAPPFRCFDFVNFIIIFSYSHTSKFDIAAPAARKFWERGYQSMSG